MRTLAVAVLVACILAAALWRVEGAGGKKWAPPMGYTQFIGLSVSNLNNAETKLILGPKGIAKCAQATADRNGGEKPIMIQVKRGQPGSQPCMAITSLREAGIQQDPEHTLYVHKRYLAVFKNLPKPYK